MKCSRHSRAICLVISLPFRFFLLCAFLSCLHLFPLLCQQIKVPNSRAAPSSVTLRVDAMDGEVVCQFLYTFPFTWDALHLLAIREVVDEGGGLAGHDAHLELVLRVSLGDCLLEGFRAFVRGAI